MIKNVIFNTGKIMNYIYCQGWLMNALLSEMNLKLLTEYLMPVATLIRRQRLSGFAASTMVCAVVPIPHYRFFFFNVSALLLSKLNT